MFSKILFPCIARYFYIYSSISFSSYIEIAAKICLQNVVEMKTIIIAHTLDEIYGLLRWCIC